MTQVLIVDDDQAIRETLQIILEEEGYQISEAEDGAAALEALQRSSERLVVLLDQLMPGLDGVEFLRAVQADPRLARQHAYLLLTAQSPIPPTVLDAAEALHVPVVKKPFELDELLALVAQASARLATAGED